MSGATRLRLDWPIDLPLTVASHGWAYLAPWRWEPDSGLLSRPERINGALGQIAVSQPNPNSPDVLWQGFAEAKHLGQILRRVRRWVSAEWNPSAAIAALRDVFPADAALIERGGGRLLRCSTFYEDFIKTLLTVNTSWSGTCRMCASLVAEPGGGAFPSPQQILDYGEERLRRIAKLGFRAPT